MPSLPRLTCALGPRSTRTSRGEAAGGRGGSGGGGAVGISGLQSPSPTFRGLCSLVLVTASRYLPSRASVFSSGHWEQQCLPPAGRKRGAKSKDRCLELRLEHPAVPWKEEGAEGEVGARLRTDGGSQSVCLGAVTPTAFLDT